MFPLVVFFVLFIVVGLATQFVPSTPQTERGKAAATRRAEDDAPPPQATLNATARVNATARAGFYATHSIPSTPLSTSTPLPAVTATETATRLSTNTPTATPVPTPIPTVTPTSTPTWYSGGTLHKATWADWQAATPANKLATAADWITNAYKPEWQTLDELHALSTELMACVDEVADFSAETWGEDSLIEDMVVSCLILMME